MMLAGYSLQSMNWHRLRQRASIGGVRLQPDLAGPIRTSKVESTAYACALPPTPFYLQSLRPLAAAVTLSRPAALPVAVARFRR